MEEELEGGREGGREGWREGGDVHVNIFDFQRWRRPIK